MSFEELISKDELLAFLPTKRTRTLLFLIEKQTAQLSARSHIEFSLNDEGEYDRESAYFQAFTLNNSKAPRVTIQQLERFSDQWSVLVPHNPRLKATLLHILTEKYNFTKFSIPHIYAALSCEDLLVQKAYFQLYKQPLDTAFKTKISFWEKCHWQIYRISQKLESLPPFWLATLITIALGLPQAFLALPIAVADLGSLVAIVLLIVLGGINILTTICMAEAIGRSHDFRSGSTFVKQLAANYLGKAGSLVLAMAVGIRVFLIALACYLGLSATMADLTSIPETAWAGILFLLGGYILSRQSLKLTVGITILFAIINIALLLLFTLLCFNNWHVDNLLYVNWDFFQNHSFQPQILDRVLGVTLMLFFGHIYVGQCAKIVLPKDPSAESLIAGSIVGTACLTLLFCLWIVAVNGAISPEILASQTGTVIEPLIALIGSYSRILGAILAISLLGMAWLRSSSLLVNLAKEWIPNREKPIFTLPRQQGSLILQSRDRFNSRLIAITYQGRKEARAILHLDLQLQGKIYQREIEVDKHWSINEICNQFPELNKPGFTLELEIESAHRDRISLKVISPLEISYQGNWEKPEVETANTPKSFIPKKPWQKVRKYAVEQRRFLLAMTPLFLVFIISEILFAIDKQSFTSVLGFAGVLGNSLVGGIFPILLLISSRRKGEILPGKVYELLNSPWLLGGIYSFKLLVILSHGLFIWQNSLARISALIVTILCLVATIVMLLTGAFMPRTVIEIQEEGQSTGQSLLQITMGGKPKITDFKLGYPEGEKSYRAAAIQLTSLDSLQYMIFHLPTKQLEELKIWLHRNQFQNASENSPELLEIYQKNNKMQFFNLKLLGDRVLFPINSQECWCKLKFSAARKLA